MALGRASDTMRIRRGAPEDRDAIVAFDLVAQPHRHQGIGRTLMQALAIRCNTAKLFTSTNQSNHPMQQFLGALGYIPSGIIHNLDPGDPELVYMLDLRDA